MLEKEIESKVADRAKQLGWLTFKFVSPSQKGVPDRIFLRDGHTVFVEFKSSTGKLARLQVEQIQKIRREGFDVYVIASVDEGVRLFDSFGPCPVPAPGDRVGA